jgi:hypothetical protein
MHYQTKQDLHMILEVDGVTEESGTESACVMLKIGTRLHG